MLFKYQNKNILNILNKYDIIIISWHKFRHKFLFFSILIILFFPIISDFMLVKIRNQSGKSKKQYFLSLRKKNIAIILYIEFHLRLWQNKLWQTWNISTEIYFELKKKSSVKIVIVTSIYQNSYSYNYNFSRSKIILYLFYILNNNI